MVVRLDSTSLPSGLWQPQLDALLCAKSEPLLAAAVANSNFDSLGFTGQGMLIRCNQRGTEQASFSFQHPANYETPASPPLTARCTIIIASRADRLTRLCIALGLSAARPLPLVPDMSFTPPGHPHALKPLVLFRQVAHPQRPWQPECTRWMLIIWLRS